MVSIKEETCHCDDPVKKSILDGCFSYYDFISFSEGTDLEFIELGDLCFCQTCVECCFKHPLCKTCGGDLRGLQYLVEFGLE